MPKNKKKITIKDIAKNIKFDEKEGKAKIDEVYRRNGVEILPNAAPDVPDNPPCDECGENWTGRYACTVCQSAFYCCKECQEAAWKAGHKKECKKLQAIAKETAEEVVNAMKDVDKSLVERVNGLERLSCGGIYKAALVCDINSVIREMMKEEKALVLDRFKSGQIVSFTNWVMCVLFRGGRREGHGMGKGAYSHIDGYRCKSYVMSSQDAFEAWFEASMELITCFVHRDISKNECVRVHTMRIARDVISSWTLVFANKKVSKAIVLGGSKEKNDETKMATAVQRAKWIVKQIKPTLVKFWNVAGELDAGGAIEGHLNQVSAMILLRLKEHKVPVDFFKLLGLKGKHKIMFNEVALPFGDHVIRKGRTINHDEAKIIMQGGRIEF